MQQGMKRGWTRSSPLSHSVTAALFLILACGAGCGNGGEPVLTPEQTVEARVRLPEYPYVENDAIRIDTRMLDDLAGAFLTGGGRIDQVPAFLFSFVPVRAFDRIALGAFSRLEEQEGLLYLSGFFGGVWLKKALDPGAARALISGGPVQGLSPETDVFSLLASVTGALNETARAGEPDAIRKLLLNSLDAFLYLYGYNLGYLESILERPPEGVTPPAGYITCSHFMDCRTPVQGISVLEDLLLLVDRLEDPPDEPWRMMRDKVEELGPPAREAGYGVWSDHLSTQEMLPEDYFTLLDLSAGFLLYCQVLVLSAMDAWVHGGEEAGRVSLAVGAGMAAWVGGYGIGLISDDSNDSLPEMEVLSGSGP
jgi:hypothetical protein